MFKRAVFVNVTTNFDWFQSLGRDSGCSSGGLVLSSLAAHHVSIPRSGFWVFKRDRLDLHHLILAGFNPSVGILGVQASLVKIRPAVGLVFQSLGRDSGCSSYPAAAGLGLGGEVSIPRSGFWVFKPSLGLMTPRS